MLPTVLSEGHRGLSSLVRVLIFGTALALLVSPASPLVMRLDSSRDPTARGLRSPVAALVLRLRRRLGLAVPAVDMPLAQRPLELASADIELLVNGAVEQVRADGAATAAQAPDDVEFRPRWVRRMDEWAAPTAAAPESGDWNDGWDSETASGDSAGGLPARVARS